MHAWREQSLYTQRCGEGSMPSSLCQCESWRCFVARSTASEHVTCHFQSHVSISFNTFLLFCALSRFDGFLTQNYCISLYTFQKIAQICAIWTFFQRPAANEKLKKSIDEFCRIIEGEDRLLILLSRRYIPPLCAFAGQEWFCQGGALQ